MAGWAKEWLLRIAMLMASLAVSLAMAEGILTAFFPLYGGRDNVTLDGTPIKDWFPPGSVYRQISNEYDARTTITDKGHRVPGTDASPDVVFLGDSFTYGFGLDDQDTFAAIYCAELRTTCANLGLPGSGIVKQTKRLEEFLTRWQWRPREVKLFVFGMSGSWSAGNDFVDNYNYARRVQAQTGGGAGPDEDGPGPGVAGRLIGSQTMLLEHSNLVRRAKYHWGPLLKTVLVDEPGAERMRQALQVTKDGLQQFDDLSRAFGFAYTIYLIVPVQDITRNTYGETLAALNSVSPKPAIPTAHLLLEQPETFYFAYDGHLNVKGSRRIAAYLVELDRIHTGS